MSSNLRRLPGLVVAIVALIVVATAPGASAAKFADLTMGATAQKTSAAQLKTAVAQFDIARIYWEYNATANDLGVHVTLDAEDWRALKIVHPDGQAIFNVTTKGAYREFGLTELFFEGAEPSLDEVPLADLLGEFPEGEYAFIGTTVDGTQLDSRPTLSHAIPAGPVVSSTVNGNAVVINWQAVTGPPTGFPGEPINIVGYQVIVESFQVTLPASSRQVTVPPEYVASLASGEIPFEVLAIEAGGNQTLTEGSFTKQ